MPTLPPEQKARFGETWAFYQKNDASWPARRDAAMASPLEREFLIQNWIREAIRGADEKRSADLAQSPRAVRASEELAKVGEPAAPLLVALFAAKDPAVADSAGRILAKIGEKAVPALGEAANAQDPKTRRWAVLSFSWMSPPREESRVLEALRDADWTVRGAAAQALARYASEDSSAALVRSLGDADAFVRIQAAETLGTRGEQRRIPALIAFLRNANGRFAADEIYAAKTALFALTRKNFGADAKAWQEWWEQSTRKP